MQRLLTGTTFLLQVLGTKVKHLLSLQASLEGP